MQTSASTAAMASASVGLQVRVGADCAGDLQRLVVHVDGDDLAPRPPFEDGDDQRADGTGTDHQDALARHVAGPRDGVPGHGGRLHQRGPAQRQPCRQLAEHPGGQVDVAANAPSVCGKRAALPR